MSGGPARGPASQPASQPGRARQQAKETLLQNATTPHHTTPHRGGNPVCENQILVNAHDWVSGRDETLRLAMCVDRRINTMLARC